jgi:outer membrane protein TolC
MIRVGTLLVIFVLISFLSVQGVKADNDRPKLYTLDECIKEALANNWSIKAKNEKMEEVGYKKKQAKADFLPKLSTSYSYTRLGEVATSEPVSLGPGMTIPGRDLNTQDNYQWKGTISQTLFSGFALMSAYELAKLGIDQSKVDLELAKLDLALRVKEAYFNILKAEKSLDVAKKAVESLESHVKVNRNFYDVGIIPINDLLKTEVELSNAQYTLIIAQNASQLAQAALNTLLARPINEPVLVEDILVYKSDKPDFNEYMTKALDNRPEIKAIDINVNQIEEQVRLAKSKYYPSAVLTYDYIKAGDDPGVSGSDFHDDSSWQATAALSWTIWEWGKANDSIREKKSLKRQLVQTRKNLEDNIRLELKKAILDLDKAEKNIPTAKKAVEQAEENLRVSQERYKAQVTTSTEVLDAQTLLSQARTNYYNALYDHNLAKAGLLRAIGEY